MTDTAPPTQDDAEDGLSADERLSLEDRGYVRVGDDLVWHEPDGRLRRERLSRLYYVQTQRGIFRVSRLTQEVIEV